MASWKLDWQHVTLIFAYLVGLTWYVCEHLIGQQLSVATVAPVAIVAISGAFAFFKNPPSTPEEAVAEGAGDEVSKAASKLNSRGFADVKAMVGIALVGCALIAMAAYLDGCSLFGAVEPPIADCATRVLADAAKGDTVAQIVADVGGPCSMDAAAVIALLLASKDPQVTASRAYVESVHVRALFVDGGAQ